jgi:hypothetical protein
MDAQEWLYVALHSLCILVQMQCRDHSHDQPAYQCDRMELLGAITIYVAVGQPLLLRKCIELTTASTPITAFFREGCCTCIRPSLGTKNLTFHSLTRVQVFESCRIFRSTITNATRYEFVIADICPALDAPTPCHISFIACRTYFTILCSFGTNWRDLRAYTSWYITWSASLRHIAASAIITGFTPDALAYPSP